LSLWSKSHRDALIISLAFFLPFKFFFIKNFNEKCTKFPTSNPTYLYLDKVNNEINRAKLVSQGFLSCKQKGCIFCKNVKTMRKKICDQIILVVRTLATFQFLDMNIVGYVPGATMEYFGEQFVIFEKKLETKR
jgi:hypothetical protein